MRLAYAGLRQNGKAFHHLYIEVDNTNHPVEGETKHNYFATVFPSSTRAIGAVYEVAKTDSGVSGLKNGMEPVAWVSDALRLRWQQQHSIANGMKASKGQVLKESQRNLLREQLAPLQSIYVSLTPTKQRLLLADIIYEITRWST